MKLTLSAGLCALLFYCASFIGGHAQAASPLAPAAAVRDGQHDFDFNIGVWHTHIKRMLDPFASSSESVELKSRCLECKLGDSCGTTSVYIVICGPRAGSINLTALSTRFERTCCSRVA